MRSLLIYLSQLFQGKAPTPANTHANSAGLISSETVTPPVPDAHAHITLDTSEGTDTDATDGSLEGTDSGSGDNSGGDSGGWDSGGGGWGM